MRNTDLSRRSLLIGSSLTLSALALNISAAQAAPTNIVFTRGKFHIIAGDDISYINPFQWIRSPQQGTGFFPVAQKASSDQLVYGNFSGVVPTSGAIYARVLARRTGDNKNYYASVASLESNSQLVITLERVVNGVTRRIAERRIENYIPAGTTTQFELSLRVRSRGIEAAVLLDGKTELQTLYFEDTALPLASAPQGIGTGAAGYISRSAQGGSLTLHTLRSEEFGEFRGPRKAKGWGNPAFEDDFDDARYQGQGKVDPTKWNIRINDYSNSHLGVSKSENINVRNGALELWTSKLAPGKEYRAYTGTRYWATAYIDSIGKFEATYFRAEARMRTPNSTKAHKGAWGSLWFRPSNTAYGAEIDVAEHFGYPTGKQPKIDQSNLALSTFHYDQSNRNRTAQWQASMGQQSAYEYHIWVVERTAEALTIWCDNVQVLRVPNDARFKRALPDSAPVNIRLSTHAGQKSYWGVPDADTQSHAFKVDYIRVWTR